MLEFVSQRKFSCIKCYMWKPSTCDYEYDKTCEIGEYLDIKKCACIERVEEMRK